MKFKQKYTVIVREHETVAKIKMNDEIIDKISISFDFLQEMT